MISTDPIFQAAHQARQKQPLYYLEIDEVDVVFAAFTAATLTALETGYGVQGYGLVGYGF
jgi:hypothetical protein